MAIRARWRIGAALVLAWLASMGGAVAIEDTLEARRAAAEAFLAAVPVGAEVDALIEEISHDVPRSGTTGPWNRWGVRWTCPTSGA